MIASGISALFKQLPNETVKPLYHYGLFWDARASLRDICALPADAAPDNVRRAYDRTRASLQLLNTNYKSVPRIETFLYHLSPTSATPASDVKALAECASLSLEQVMQREFPGFFFMEKISSHYLDKATKAFTQTKDQISGTVQAGVKLAQATVEGMNPPLKGLGILDPFKRTSLAPAATAEMVKQKAEEVRAWFTAFASMKCVNAFFNFQEGNNPLHFLQQIDTAGEHGSLYKWAAKRLYNGVRGLFASPLKRLMERLHTAFTGWLQKGTESRVLDVLHWLEEWLSSVSDGYTQVAAARQWGGKRVVDLLDENIRAQLPGKKQVDLKQLCSALVYAGLNLCAVEWTRSMEKSGLLWPIKKILKLCLYLPEWLFNAFLRLTGHFILMRWVNLPRLIDTALKGPSSPETPQMKEWTFQKVGVMVNHVDERLKRPGEKISDTIQRDMHACLQVLLEVLHKSNYPTVEKLQEYIRLNLTLKDKMVRELEETALPIAMPVVALGLGSALEKAFEPAELLGTVHDLLSMCDKTFTPRLLEHPATDTTGALIDALFEKTACYKLETELPQRIAVDQATGFVKAIKLAFAESAYLRSLLYKAMTTSLFFI